jgi:hypothetical protein
LELCLSFGTSPSPRAAGKSARTDFPVAGNSTKEARWHEENDSFWTKFSRELINNHEDRPNTFDNNPQTKFSPSSQTDHGNPHDFGSSNDFLNEFSSKFKSNEVSLLVDTSEDIGIASNLLERSANGKPGDRWRLNDSANKASTKSGDDQNLMLTVTHDDIAICSNKESSLESE